MTNNKQQTAVEWLFLNLKSHFEHDGDLLESVQMSMQQAKEMEREQIIHSYNQSWHFRDKPYLTAEQYYNKTYGGNK